MSDDEIADWEKILLLEKDRDRWKAEAERLAAMIAASVDVLVFEGAKPLTVPVEPRAPSPSWPITT